MKGDFSKMSINRMNKFPEYDFHIGTPYFILKVHNQFPRKQTFMGSKNVKIPYLLN